MCRDGTIIRWGGSRVLHENWDHNACACSLNNLLQMFGMVYIFSHGTILIGTQLSIKCTLYLLITIPIVLPNFNILLNFC